MLAAAVTRGITPRGWTHRRSAPARPGPAPARARPPRSRDGRRAAKASRFSSVSRHRAHSRSRSAPVAARPVTWHGRPAQLDVGLRVRLQVQPPRRLARAPPVHRQGDEVRAVLDVAEHHAALAAGAPPRDGQPQGAPLRRLAAATGRRRPPVTRYSAAVHPPGEVDEPPRRQAGRPVRPRRPLALSLASGRPILPPTGRERYSRRLGTRRCRRAAASGKGPR